MERNGPADPEIRKWTTRIKFDLHPFPAKNRTLCQYLADEPVEVGMRAYIGYVRMEEL